MSLPKGHRKTRSQQPGHAVLERFDGESGTGLQPVSPNGWKPVSPYQTRRCPFCQNEQCAPTRHTCDGVSGMPADCPIPEPWKHGRSFCGRNVVRNTEQRT